MGVCTLASLCLSCYVKEDLRRINYKVGDDFTKCDDADGT